MFLDYRKAVKTPRVSRRLRRHFYTSQLDTAEHATGGFDEIGISTIDLVDDCNLKLDFELWDEILGTMNDGAIV